MTSRKLATHVGPAGCAGWWVQPALGGQSPEGPRSPGRGGSRGLGDCWASAGKRRTAGSRAPAGPGVARAGHHVRGCESEAQVSAGPSSPEGAWGGTSPPLLTPGGPSAVAASLSSSRSVLPANTSVSKFPVCKDAGHMGSEAAFLRSDVCGDPLSRDGRILRCWGSDLNLGISRGHSRPGATRHGCFRLRGEAGTPAAGALRSLPGPPGRGSSDRCSWVGITARQGPSSAGAGSPRRPGPPRWAPPGAADAPLDAGVPLRYSHQRSCLLLCRGFCSPKALSLAMSSAVTTGQAVLEH